jgi:hypothetical protein
MEKAQCARCRYLSGKLSRAPTSGRGLLLTQTPAVTTGPTQSRHASIVADHRSRNARHLSPPILTGREPSPLRLTSETYKDEFTLSRTSWHV